MFRVISVPVSPLHAVGIQVNNVPAVIISVTEGKEMSVIM